jgi:hypothetical protein
MSRSAVKCIGVALEGASSVSSGLDARAVAGHGG